MTDFSREHYLKLPKFFQNRIFAIREVQTRNAAVTVSAASAAVSVNDSPAVFDNRSKVDSSSNDKQQ